MLLDCTSDHSVSVPSLLWPLTLQNSGVATVTPGTKPIHAGEKSWGINFCTNACGACIRTCANTGNMLEELFLKYVLAPSQICILTFAPSVCMDTVAVFTHP